MKFVSELVTWDEAEGPVDFGERAGLVVGAEVKPIEDAATAKDVVYRALVARRPGSMAMTSW